MSRTPALDQHQLITGLVTYLNNMYSDYPVLSLGGMGLIASYARVDVDLRVELDCATVKRAANAPNRFTAPSFPSAIDFIAAVEAVRQRTSVPFLQFQTGLGPS